MMLFQKGIGYTFKNEELLRHALTHPSYNSTNSHRLAINHFERLEFIGDRVLGLIVGDMLYRHFFSANEGELARRLAGLVCRETLGVVAGQLGISNSLKYARATEENNAQWLTFLSDACEALIGAIYLDGGMVAATRVVQKFWAPLLEQQDIAIKDPKTQLQEYTQARFKVLPKYKITQQTGPSHKPEITVECCVKSLIVTEKGASKKLAENLCAQEMLKRLKEL